MSGLLSVWSVILHKCVYIIKQIHWFVSALKSQCSVLVESVCKLDFMWRLQENDWTMTAFKFRLSPLVFLYFFGLLWDLCMESSLFTWMWTIRKKLKAQTEGLIFPWSSKGSGLFNTVSGCLEFSRYTNLEKWSRADMELKDDYKVRQLTSRPFAPVRSFSRLLVLFISNYEKVNKWSRYSKEWMKPLKVKRKYRKPRNRFHQKIPRAWWNIIGSL